MMNRLVVFLFATMLMLQACVQTERGIQVACVPTVYPQLKNKAFNHSLQLRIIKNDSINELDLSEIKITFSKETELSNVASLSAYYMGTNNRFIKAEDMAFSVSTKIDTKVVLKGIQPLLHDTTYLWISLNLSPSASIDDCITMSCTGLIIDGENMAIQNTETNSKLRIGVALRNENFNGIKAHRIPGLTTTNKGTLLACYDARYNGWGDLQGHMDIGLNRSTDGGNNWEPMQIVLDMGAYGGLPEKYNGVSDACLLVDKNSDNIFIAGLWMHGVINDEGVWVEGLTDTSTVWNHQWLTMGSQPGFDIKQTSQFILAKSTDDGKTWSKPINLTKMCKKESWWLWAPAPGAGITMKDGTLVLPTQGRDETGMKFSNIAYSKDGGVTWKTSEPAYTNTSECAVVELENGDLMLSMRDDRNWENKSDSNGRAIFTTSDMGNTWHEHSSSHGALIESTCMASLHRHDSLLLFSNPNSKYKRHHLSIKTSFDDGMTWPESNVLLYDQGQSGGYSCITSVDSTHVGILYESSQAHLVYLKIPVRDLLAKE